MTAEPKWEYRFKVSSHKKSALGFRAVVQLLRADGNELFRHEVKLWDDKSRQDFIKRCLSKINGNFTENRRAEYRRDADAELRQLEGTLSSDAKSQATGSDVGSVPTALTAQEKSDAEAILKDQALLFKLGTAFHQVGLVRERARALLLYLVVTSRLLPKVISAAIKAESSTGKDFILTEVVLRFVPEDAYVFLSGMSKQALIYSEADIRHKHLVIAEANGAEAASYNIRTLLSENRLVFEVAEKDPETNRLVTRRVKREGPTGLLTTTTLPHLHPENETRLLSLSLDESEEQTEAIKKAKAEAAERGEQHLAGIDLSPWVNAQRLLKPVRVRIPYAVFLADRTPSRPLRMRRDFNKLLSFIEASAACFQFQRELVGDDTIEASLADYYNAKILFEDVFFHVAIRSAPEHRVAHGYDL